MIAFEGLEENLKFIAVEVENQVRSTMSFIGEPSRKLYDAITTKDDYIDNLKTIIENKCFSIIHTERNLQKKEIDRIRSIQTIAVNLERIADFCVNISRQMSYIEDFRALRKFDPNVMMDEVLKALGKVLPVLGEANLTGALMVCKAEHTLDQMFKDRFDRIMFEIQKGLRIPELITMLFIFRYIERMGDSLLNIGEALIFSIIGEKIKIEQFQALQTTLAKTGVQDAIGDIDFQAIWGTRSGCRIGRVGHKGNATDTPDVYGSIFKEGVIRKIKGEKASLERWGRLFPGLTPKVYSYHEEGENASLLVEYLPGCTLDEVMLASDMTQVDNALFALQQTLMDVWEATLKTEPSSTNYIRQFLDRLEDVRRMHPDALRPAARLGGQVVDATDTLLSKCLNIETTLPAPLTVMIHGDFNISNVLYDHFRERIHFIDLYRSKDFDYVQDISVFLISNFRMPIFDPALRERLNHVMTNMLGFARRFAANHDDRTFDARMALALARSLFTSARFELNPDFSREMILRSHFLMEKIAAHEGSVWSDFHLTPNILIL